MKILYIWDADYPWDVRVEKICSALIEGGHEVHIAARNLKKRPVYEVLNEVHIHRVKIYKNDGLNYMLSFPAFFSPLWAKFLDTVAAENGIELIIVRDLPMAIAGIWAGRRHKIPVIFDMAEDYVSMVRDIWRKRKYQGFNLVVRNPYLAKLVEKYTFRNIDSIMVVVEEAIEVVANGGGDVKKVFIVSNTPDMADLQAPNIAQDDHIREIRGRRSMIYTGGIQIGRGIQTVIDAIPSVLEVFPDFLFVVIGDGYAGNELKGLIKSRGLDDSVLWLGWIDHSRISTYIKAAKVGIIPHYVSDHVNTTIPNKIFDYMMYGLPILASDARPMQRVIETEQCGLTYKSGSHKDLADKLIRLFTSSADYGENGKRAVRERYNWENDKETLLKVVDIYKR